MYDRKRTTCKFMKVFSDVAPNNSFRVNGNHCLGASLDTAARQRRTTVVSVAVVRVAHLVGQRPTMVVAAPRHGAGSALVAKADSGIGGRRMPAV